MTDTPHIFDSEDKKRQEGYDQILEWHRSLCDEGGMVAGMKTGRVHTRSVEVRE